MGSSPLRVRPDLWNKMVRETLIPSIGPYGLVTVFEKCAEVVQLRAEQRARQGKLVRTAHKYHWRDIVVVVLYRLIRNPSLSTLHEACGISRTHQNAYFEKYVRMVRGRL